MSRRKKNWRLGLLTGTRKKVVLSVMIGMSCHVTVVACGLA
jgi:hypothetical protein